MKQKFTLIFSLLCLTNLALSKAEGIVIDGSFSDWDNIQYAHNNASGTGGTLLAVKTFGTATDLYFLVEGTTAMTLGTLQMYLDTDNNPATGYNNSWQYGAGAGADFRLEGNAPWWGGLYQHSGNPADDWAGFTQVEDISTNASLHSRSAVVEIGGKNFIEFSIAKTYLGTLGEFINIAILEQPSESGTLPAINPDASTAKYLQIPVLGEKTLPVSFAFFKAIADESRIKLNWSTYSEHNNSYFELYKSTDGVLFDKTATIKGEINSNSQLYYSYTDFSVSSGSIYYQLKQVDLNGTVTPLGTVEVKSKLKKSQFNVYKVPGQDALEISVYAGKNITSQFRFSDINGRLITDRIIQLSPGNQVIPLSSSAKSGIYVATLSSTEGVISQKVLITQ